VSKGWYYGFSGGFCHADEELPICAEALLECNGTVSINCRFGHESEHLGDPGFLHYEGYEASLVVCQGTPEQGIFYFQVAADVC
jgi:hypothetical protein